MVLEAAFTPLARRVVRPAVYGWEDVVNNNLSPLQRASRKAFRHLQTATRLIIRAKADSESTLKRATLCSTRLVLIAPLSPSAKALV